MTAARSCATHRPLAEVLMTHSIPEPNSGCWLWERAVTPKGYPQLTNNYKHWEGHRASWTAFRGEIPHGAHVLHKCNNSVCINPDHLYLGGNLENCADRIRAGTQARPPRMFGINHPHAKLKPEDVIAIRKAPGGLRDLAKRFAVTTHTIAAVRGRRLWKHVEESQ